MLLLERLTTVYRQQVQLMIQKYLCIETIKILLLSYSLHYVGKLLSFMCVISVENVMALTSSAYALRCCNIYFAYFFGNISN